MIPHSLFLLETEDGVEAIQDGCQSPLEVTRSTRDGVVLALESRQCRNRCVVQTWAAFVQQARLTLRHRVVHIDHGLRHICLWLSGILNSEPESGHPAGYQSISDRRFRIERLSIFMRGC